MEQAKAGDKSGMVDMSKKLRGGMNRDQFGGAQSAANAKKPNNNDDGDKEYYFDCNILDKLDTNQAQQPMFGQEEQKADTQLDLMDFISKSDFSTVGG